MANNRMYLVNTRTGDKIYLAKYYPSTGWYCVTSIANIDDVFHRADFGHLSDEDKERNARKIGFGEPYSGGGMYGAEWVIELEESGG